MLCPLVYAPPRKVGPCCDEKHLNYSRPAACDDLAARAYWQGLAAGTALSLSAPDRDVLRAAPHWVYKLQVRLFPLARVGAPARPVDPLEKGKTFRSRSNCRAAGMPVMPFLEMVGVVA